MGRKFFFEKNVPKNIDTPEQVDIIRNHETVTLMVNGVVKVSRVVKKKCLNVSHFSNDSPLSLSLTFSHSLSLSLIFG